MTVYHQALSSQIYNKQGLGAGGKGGRKNVIWVLQASEIELKLEAARPHFSTCVRKHSASSDVIRCYFSLGALPHSAYEIGLRGEEGKVRWWRRHCCLHVPFHSVAEAAFCMSQKWEKKDDFKIQVIACCIRMPGGFTIKYLWWSLKYL